MTEMEDIATEIMDEVTLVLFLETIEQRFSFGSAYVLVQMDEGMKSEMRGKVREMAGEEGMDEAMG